MSTTVETETDRVRVSKSVETDGAETVVAAFRIASERNEPVEIRLQDRVPSGHNAQFQTKDEHRWTTQDESVTYERRLEPNETVGTAYKWSATGAESYDGETTEPTLEVTVVAPAAAPATEAAAEATAGFTRGASEAVFSFDGLGTEIASTDVSASVSGGTSEASESETPTPDERDGTDSAGTDDADTDETGVSDGETDADEAEADEAEANDAATPSSVDGGVDHDDGTGESVREFSMPDDEVDVNQLIEEERPAQAPGEAVGEPAETQTGGYAVTQTDESAETGDETDTDEGQHVASRGNDDSTAGAESAFERPETVVADHELTEPPAERGSLDARVRYLQTQFQDMAAYIDAMQEFIDEHGSGQQVLTALTTDMEAVHERLDSIADQQSTIVERLDATESRLASLDDRVETREATVDERLGDTDSRLASMEDRIETREATVDDSLDGLASDLEAMRGEHESVRSDIEELRTFHDTLKDAI